MSTGTVELLSEAYSLYKYCIRLDDQFIKYKDLASEIYKFVQNVDDFYYSPYNNNIKDITDIIKKLSNIITKLRQLIEKIEGKNFMKRVLYLKKYNDSFMMCEEEFHYIENSFMIMKMMEKDNNINHNIFMENKEMFTDGLEKEEKERIEIERRQLEEEKRKLQEEREKMEREREKRERIERERKHLEEEKKKTTR